MRQGTFPSPARGGAHQTVWGLGNPTILPEADEVAQVDPGCLLRA